MLHPPIQRHLQSLSLRNLPQKNAQSPPNPVAKPNGGKLVFKPLDANPNQNVVLRRAMINRNQLAGINIGQDQAVAESMSKENFQA